MFDTNIEIISVIRQDLKISHKSAEAARKVQEVELNYTTNNCTKQNLLKRFNGGDLSLEMKARIRRSSLVNLEDLKQKIKINANTNTRKLSEEIKPCKVTIYRVLHKLHKMYNNSREIPHELTKQQVNHRVKISKTHWKTHLI